MRRASSVVPLLVAIVSSPCAVASLGAQAAPTSADSTIGARASRDDSLAELRALDAVVRRNPVDYAAWHRKGMLAWALLGRRRQAGVLAQSDILLGRDADTSLWLATHSTPPNARFLLDAARYFRASATVATRLMAAGFANDAYAAARAAGDAKLASVARDLAGTIDWRLYEQFADRYAVPPSAFESVAGTPDAMRRMLGQVARQQAAGTLSGGLYLRDAEDAFREAVATDPDAQRPRRHLYMLLADRSRWSDLRNVAAADAAARPRNAMAWLALGLAAHRLYLDAEAASALDSGLARLAPDERARLTRLTRLLPPKGSSRWFDSTRYVAENREARVAIERAFWQRNKPIALITLNRNELEFVSRVVHAELRWTVEEFDVRGADSDRGDIFVRYGPPARVVALGSSHGRAEGAATAADSSASDSASPPPPPPSPAAVAGEMTGDGETSGFGVDGELWLYALGYSFVFVSPPASGVANLEGSFRRTADEQRARMPLLWATPRPGDETDSVSVQTARFRAPRDSLDLVVSAALPIARLLGDVGRRISVDVGLTMLSPTATIAMRDSTRLRIAREDAEFESTRSWRGRLGAGAYDYRVEGYGVASHREARAAATMAPRATAGFGTSDLLVAASVTRPPGVARRWSDFSTVPNGGVFRRGAPVALLWETYALAAGADSISRYRVTLSVVPLGAAAAGPSLAARVFAGAMGRGTRSIARSALAYERQVPATPWSVDYLSLDLSGAPPGAYVVRVTVEDAISKQSTTTSARIRVVE